MRTSLLALLGSTFYATLRYNVFKGVPWSDWPTYTLNKALGLSALLLLALAVVGRTSRRPSEVGILPIASLFGFVHVLLSLTLLSPAYYENFFEQGRLTAGAGLSMLLGSVAAVAMAAGKGRRPEQAPASRRLAALAFVIGVHAALQGLAGWLTPSEWPGALPPITLISFLLGLAAAVAAVPRRPA